MRRGRKATGLEKKTAGLPKDSMGRTIIGGSADSWNPNPNGNITALALDNSSGNLYAGGTYSSIGGG